MRAKRIDELGDAEHGLLFGLAHGMLLELGFPTALVQHATQQDEQPLPLARRHQSLMERVVQLISCRSERWVELALFHFGFQLV